MYPLLYILDSLSIVRCLLRGVRQINVECTLNSPTTVLTSEFCIKTEMAPTTALRGRNISEDSLAISTAILAAAYAVCQPESLPWLVPSSADVPRGLLNGEPMENAMEADERARTLDSF